MATLHSTNDPNYGAPSQRDLVQLAAALPPGGNGDDTFSVTAAQVVAGEVYNGVGGTDTISFGGPSGEAFFNQTSVISIEKLTYEA